MYRYQGENSGKFPTVSHAKKEVGGSYYVVKKIMQELEYNSKLSSSNDGKEVSSKTEVRSSYLSCGSNSDADEYKPSPETSMLMTTEDVKEMTIEDVKEEEQHKLQLDIESIPDEKPNQYFQQPLPEVSSAKKSENSKEETTCESVLDANNLESRNEEYQPYHEYSVPKVPKNSKEVKPNQVVVDMDGSESIAKEHRKSTGLVVYLLIYSSVFFSQDASDCDQTDMYSVWFIPDLDEFIISQHIWIKFQHTLHS